MKGIIAKLALAGALAFSPAAFAQDYDIVLNNGRVIDPETGLDAIRHVGIRGGRKSRPSPRPRWKASARWMSLAVSWLRALLTCTGTVRTHPPGACRPSTA